VNDINSRQWKDAQKRIGKRIKKENVTSEEDCKILEEIGDMLIVKGFKVEFRICPDCGVKYIAVFPKSYDPDKC